MTLLTIFHKAAEEFPHKGIGYIQENGEQVFLTYRELKEAAAKILGGYRELGLTAGDKVILALSSKEEFIPAFWGCILGGMISVPLPAPTSFKRANPQGKLDRWQNSWIILPFSWIKSYYQRSGTQLFPESNFSVSPIFSLTKLPPHFINLPPKT